MEIFLFWYLPFNPQRLACGCKFLGAGARRGKDLPCGVPGVDLPGKTGSAVLVHDVVAQLATDVCIGKATADAAERYNLKRQESWGLAF